MSHFQPITPLFGVLYADADTTVTVAGGIQAQGYQIMVVDNNGTAAAHNIVISGPISGSTSGSSITTNYGSALLTWDGATYHQIVGP